MPRQPRYFVAGIPQHVIQRGVNRQPTFFERQDYERYLACLARSAIRYGCRIHAFVLMTNHTHLLVTPEERMSLPRMMQAMGREYVQPTNKIQGRTGTLWEGRYKASPVQDDEYLLTCYRYIELNPVRAGLAVSPGAYEYSSYLSNALGKHNPLISPHATYFGLGRDKEGRCRAYRKLFQDKFSDHELSRIRSSTKACRIIGDEDFLAQMESKIGRPLRPGKVGRPCIRKQKF